MSRMKELLSKASKLPWKPFWTTGVADAILSPDSQVVGPAREDIDAADALLLCAAVNQVPAVEELLAYIGRITKNDLAATPLMCKEELDAHVRAIRAAQKER